MLLAFCAVVFFIAAVVAFIVAGVQSQEFQEFRENIPRVVVFCFLFGIIFLSLAIFLVGFAVYEAHCGFPARQEFLERGAFYKLVDQHTIDGEYLALLVGPDGVRLYELDRLLPAGTTYVRAVQQGNERMHLEPVPPSPSQ